VGQFTTRLVQQLLKTDAQLRDLLASDLSAAVAQGLEAPRLLFRKTFPVHSIEYQGKPSCLKIWFSGFNGPRTEGM